MWTQLITGPTVEPVTLDEAKLHARVDESLDDSLVTNQIITARQMVEQYINCAIITQTWKVWYDLKDKPFSESYRALGAVIDSFPYFITGPEQRVLELPLGPVQTVTSFNSFDPDNNETLFDASNYRVSQNYVKLNDKSNWPALLRLTDCIVIQYVTGFASDATAVPFPIKQAILMLIAHWYENRGASYDPMNVSQTPGQLPYGVSALLQPYRIFAI